MNGRLSSWNVDRNEIEWMTKSIHHKTVYLLEEVYVQDFLTILISFEVPFILGRLFLRIHLVLGTLVGLNLVRGNSLPHQP